MLLKKKMKRTEANFDIIYKETSHGNTSLKKRNSLLLSLLSLYLQLCDFHIYPKIILAYIDLKLEVKKIKVLSPDLE